MENVPFPFKVNVPTPASGPKGAPGRVGAPAWPSARKPYEPATDAVEQRGGPPPRDSFSPRASALPAIAVPFVVCRISSSRPLSTIAPLKPTRLLACDVYEQSLFTAYVPVTVA